MENKDEMQLSKEAIERFRKAIETIKKRREMTTKIIIKSTGKVLIKNDENKWELEDGEDNYKIQNCE